MACVTECLWMSLTDCATTLASDPEKMKQAYETWKRIVELVKNDIKPKDIMTRKAFLDAMTLDNAIWWSTNVTLHLPAIAKEAWININLSDFDKISKKTPNICHLSPAWPYYIADLWASGWIKQVMKNLEEKLNLDRISVNWNLKDIISPLKKVDNDVIRATENPYYKEWWVASLKWNICKESVVKQTSVEKEMLVHTWLAKVFYSEKDLVDSVENLKISEWDIIVLPFQWPAWAPGMPEMLTPTSIIKWAWYKCVALITDWRFSWWTAGPCIGHIFPEAYNGGKIWLIRDSDIIEIDIPNRILNVKVSEEEFEKRKKDNDFIIPDRIMTPLLEKFRKSYTTI
jgi:dihydroxy-acid dehydratase